MKSIMECMQERRSVRNFLADSISREKLELLLEAANWAPSGDNMQPWRFAVIHEDRQLLQDIAELTVYKSFVRQGAALIVVFLDRDTVERSKIYRGYEKHVQAIGAAIQNLLLAAVDMGLGTCWIGEILKNEHILKDRLDIQPDWELMAVIAVGYPGKQPVAPKRKDWSELSRWY